MENVIEIIGNDIKTTINPDFYLFSARAETNYHDTYCMYLYHVLIFTLEMERRLILDEEVLKRDLKEFTIAPPSYRITIKNSKKTLSDIRCSAFILSYIIDGNLTVIESEKLNIIDRKAFISQAEGYIRAFNEKKVYSDKKYMMNNNFFSSGVILGNNKGEEE